MVCTLGRVRGVLSEEVLQMTYTVIALTSENYGCLVRETGMDLPTVDVLRWYEKKCATETIMHRIGAITPEGRLVGFAMAVTGPWDPILRQGYFEISVQVAPDWRKKGIGTRLYEEITTFASEQKAIALQAPIRETQSHDIEWAERRGFIKTLHTFASELSLPQFDPNSFNASITAAESTGLRFISLEGYPQDDESFKRFVDFYWNLALDSPGMEGKPRPSFEEMKRFSQSQGYGTQKA